MIQRNTQTAEFWHADFVPSADDWAHLYDRIAEAGEPLSLEMLAMAVIEYRCRQEEEAIRREMSKGPSYQPKDQYQVGQQVIFPAFEYALGTVTGTRQGRNPAYGEFTVIEVAFEGETCSILLSVMIPTSLPLSTTGTRFTLCAVMIRFASAILELLGRVTTL